MQVIRREGTMSWNIPSGYDEEEPLVTLEWYWSPRDTVPVEVLIIDEEDECINSELPDWVLEEATEFVVATLNERIRLK